MWLLELVALTSAVSIGMGLGGRGQWKNYLINYGAVILLGATIWLMIVGWKSGLLTIGVNLLVLYSISLLLNRRYKGLDHAIDNADAENIFKNLQKIIDEKRQRKN